MVWNAEIRLDNLLLLDWRMGDIIEEKTRGFHFGLVNEHFSDYENFIGCDKHSYGVWMNEDLMKSV